MFISGNFVELRGLLSVKAKAGHLTYISNAEVGSDVNFGAGTITVNYDSNTSSEHKLPTRLYRKALTWLHRLKLGNALLTAEITITDDVPADSAYWTWPPGQ